MAQAARQDTWRIHVQLNQETIYGLVFDKRTGGEVDSEDTKYNPGDMQPPVSLGGRKTIGNITLQRLYQYERDHKNMDKWLAAVGSGRVDVTQVMLDLHGNPYDGDKQKKIQWSGTLKRVLVPEVDSESGSAALLEIEVTPDGTVTLT